MNILLVFKWNKQPCCQTLTRNQHFKLFRPEINVFELTRCMKWLYSFFKWNQHPCCQTLKNFNFHFFYQNWIMNFKTKFLFYYFFWKLKNEFVTFLFSFFFFKNLKKETAQSSFSFFTKKLKMNVEKWVEKFVLIFNRNEKWKWTKFSFRIFKILREINWHSVHAFQTLTCNQHFKLFRPQIDVFEPMPCMKWFYSFLLMKSTSLLSDLNAKSIF